MGLLKDAAASISLPLATTPMALLPSPTVSTSNRKRLSTRDLVIPVRLPSIGSAMSVGTVTLQEATLYVVSLKNGSSFILLMILFPLQCDSESEEIEKANNHQELRGHSPTGGNRAAEFVAPVKQRSFSPGHAGVANNSHNASSNSNTPTGENCNNLRWVGLSGSPRPATAVAPLGHLQVLLLRLLQPPVFYFHLTSIVLITLEWTEASGLSTNGRRCWSKSRTTCSPFASATPASSCGRIST